MTEHDHECYCGTASPNFKAVAMKHTMLSNGSVISVPIHKVGQGGCIRHIVESPTEVANGWIVDGHLVTEYTLKFQWFYFQHPCGCWSAPKI